MIRIIFISIISILLVGCATTAGSNYHLYLEQTSKLAASQNAAEAACLLVIAEGMKNSKEDSSKVIFASQIDRCRKEPIKIQPPPPAKTKNWLVF